MMQIPDFTAAIGPGYYNIPTSMLTAELRESSVKSSIIHDRPDAIPISSEIIAPDGLKNQDIDLWYELPEIYEHLQKGPDFIHTRIPQLGLIGTLYRHNFQNSALGVVIQAPIAENPEHFTESSLPQFYGYN